MHCAGPRASCYFTHMRRWGWRWAICLAAGLWLAAPAGAPGRREARADEAKPPEKKSYIVAAMGDSLTDPRSHGGKYLEVLRKKCPGSRFDSYGVGGNMVNQMRKRFLRDVFGEREGAAPEPRPAYTHLLVLGGINDICSDESAQRTNDKIQADLGWMYRTARARGLQVVALTLPPWAGFTRYYNQRRARSTFEMNAWIRAQHTGGQVDALLDVYPLLSCGDPEHLCDRYGWPDKVHWSKAGHRVVGEALHRSIFSDCR